MEAKLAVWSKCEQKKERKKTFFFATRSRSFALQCISDQFSRRNWKKKGYLGFQEGPVTLLHFQIRGLLQNFTFIARWKSYLSLPCIFILKVSLVSNIHPSILTFLFQFSTYMSKRYRERTQLRLTSLYASNQFAVSPSTLTAACCLW